MKAIFVRLLIVYTFSLFLGSFAQAARYSITVKNNMGSPVVVIPSKKECKYRVSPSSTIKPGKSATVSYRGHSSTSWYCGAAKTGDREQGFYFLVKDGSGKNTCCMNFLKTRERVTLSPSDSDSALITCGVKARGQSEIHAGKVYKENCPKLPQ